MSSGILRWTLIDHLFEETSARLAAVE